MARALAAIGLAALLFTAAGAQSTSSQTFEVADVRVSPGVTNLFSRTMFRGGRYEIHNARSRPLRYSRSNAMKTH
jgi:hypothetical protein